MVSPTCELPRVLAAMPVAIANDISTVMVRVLKATHAAIRNRKEGTGDRKVAYLNYYGTCQVEVE